MKIEKLFEVTTDEELAAGHIMWMSTCSRTRCVPARLRMPTDVAESFSLRDIRTGVEPLLVVGTAPGDGEAAPVQMVSVVLEVGMDFSIEVKNISEKPQRFSAEVWGYPSVPTARWRKAIVVSAAEATQAETAGAGDSATLECPATPGRVWFTLTCESCGHRYELIAGSRLPLWCAWCVEGLDDV